MKKQLIIGSRGSRLALVYAEKVKKELKKNILIKFIVKPIKTRGDKYQNKRLGEYGGKGLFSKSIEKELLKKKIDIAVHALKDMPTFETKKLITDCFLKRNSSNEILISKNKKIFSKLKKNSIIGTSSYRREYQLKTKRNDLNFKIIRGNVETRIKKLNKGEYDAIVLAKAGLKLLNLEKKISQEFSTNFLIPSAGQGIIAIQCRKEDKFVRKILKSINHKDTSLSAKIERQVLRKIKGDCDTAIGVHSKINKKKIKISAELFSKDGSRRFFIKKTVNLGSLKNIGNRIGKTLLDKSRGYNI